MKPNLDDDMDYPDRDYIRARVEDKGRLKPPRAQGGEYIYSPPAWRVCGECEGTGCGGAPFGQCDRNCRDCSYNCKTCHGTGRIPLFYTPEQWAEAGGAVTDDLPVWIKSDGEWMIFTVYGDFKDTQMDIIIATEAGRPPGGYTP